LEVTVSESNEKWFIFALIALAIYYFYFYKKGKAAPLSTASSAGAGFNAIPLAPGTYYDPTTGSVVNPTNEVGAGTPYQTSTPVLFNPAQPSSVPYSQRVGWTSGVPDVNPIKSSTAQALRTTSVPPVVGILSRPRYNVL
jgi:hypothetical protein